MSEKEAAADGLEQLLSLEEKINQTIDLLQATRAEKEGLQQENRRLRRERDQQSAAARKLQDRLERLEQEREAVRARIQKLVEQVDSLTAEKSEAS